MVPLSKKRWLSSYTQYMQKRMPTGNKRWPTCNKKMVDLKQKMTD